MIQNIDFISNNKYLEKIPVLKYAVENNLFAEYSDNHLFFQKDINSFDLVNNLFCRLLALKDAFGYEIVSDIIQNKLSAGKNKYDVNKLWEAISEVEIISNILNRLNVTNPQYEPKYNGDKNPEFSFEYMGNEFEVEVKCANFSKLEYENGGIVLNYRDKIPPEVYNSLGVKVNYPSDNKIKDYLLSAEEKFSSETQDTNIKRYGILFVNWQDAMRFKYAYSILTNKDSGLFTPNSYLNNELNTVKQFEKICAVVFFFRGVKYNDLQYVYADYSTYEKYYVKNPFSKKINNDFLSYVLEALPYNYYLD